MEITNDVRKALILEGWQPPPQKPKIITLEEFKRFGIDCEFGTAANYSMPERWELGLLKSIVRPAESGDIIYVRHNGYGIEKPYITSSRCRPRLNHWMSPLGLEDCVVPVGFSYLVDTLDDDMCITIDMDENPKRLTFNDLGASSFMIQHKLDGFKYEWELRS